MTSYEKFTFQLDPPPPFPLLRAVSHHFTSALLRFSHTDFHLCFLFFRTLKATCFLLSPYCSCCPPVAFLCLCLIIPLSFLLLHYFLMIPVGSLTTRHSPFTSLSPPLSLSLFLSSFVSTLILPVCNFTFLVCLSHPSPHPSSLPLYTPDCYLLSPFFVFAPTLFSSLFSTFVISLPF